MNLISQMSYMKHYVSVFYLLDLYMVYCISENFPNLKHREIFALKSWLRGLSVSLFTPREVLFIMQETYCSPSILLWTSYVSHFLFYLIV